MADEPNDRDKKIIAEMVAGATSTNTKGEVIPFTQALDEWLDRWDENKKDPEFRAGMDRVFRILGCTIDWDRPVPPRAAPEQEQG